MKLYVCWGTFQTPRPGGHPCHNAHKALIDAGYDPEVKQVHGLGIGPLKWMTDGRREVQELTGQPAVPVLVTARRSPTRRRSSIGHPVTPPRARRPPEWS